MREPTRREMLKLGAAAALGCQRANLAWASPADQSLRSAAASAGVVLGIAIGQSNIFREPDKGFICGNFGMITPGTEMKWAALRPDESTYNWAGADTMMTFAKANRLLLHGHTLCWNMYNPSWLESKATRATARDLLQDHIRHVTGRYKGLIDSWDVVNEPIRIGVGRAEGYLPGPWFNALGPEYIDIAFHTVAETDPRAVRQLNLDNVEQDADYCERTRRAALAAVRAALGRGVPIQAIGIESHLQAHLPPTSPAFEAFIKELRGLGLTITVTELDVNDTKLSGPPAERLRIVADYYERYLEAMIPLSNTQRIGIWSLSDKNNWLDHTYPRADHAEHHPGLVSDAFAPNPAYHAVRKALWRSKRPGYL
jgi:endo-1,4-beta-xylanase